MNQEYFNKLTAGLIPVGVMDQETQKKMEQRGATVDSTDEDYFWYRKARMQMSTDSLIGTILSELDDCPLECDGMTRMISSILTKAGIVHDVLAGRVHMDGSARIVQPHLWIALRDDTVIDFRIRMWLGNQVEVPHGHFNLKDFQHMHYQGTVIEFTEEDQKYAHILATINQIDSNVFVQKLIQIT